MRTLIIIITTLVAAITLTGCSGSDKGTQAAASLRKACGNPQALKELAASYIASRDSLFFPGDAGMMDKAFIDACAGNDSLQVLAQAIALDAKELGKVTGEYLVESLQNGTIDGHKAAERLGMIHTSLFLLGRDQDINTCYAAIDEVAQTLPEQQQMEVYAHSCSPATLGENMKKEHDTDPEGTDRRAHIVETILKGDNLNEFKSHYYSK